VTVREGDAWRDPRDLVRALIAAEPPAAGTSDPDGVVPLLERLCNSLARGLSMTGAAVNLMSAAGADGVAVVSSDDRARLLEELQYVTGEGPCHDAFNGRRPVLTPDLRFSAEQKWPEYCEAALAAGVVAVFAFPLCVGGVSLGVLDVYCDRAVPLDQNQVGMALAFAQIATEILLDGRLITEEGELEAGLASTVDYRSEIPQAQGMLTVALDVSLAEALVRMRAQAFSSGLPLIELAHGVVSGSIDPGSFVGAGGESSGATGDEAP
jgi:hypothetical protein